MCQFTAPQTTVCFVICFCSFAYKFLALKSVFFAKPFHVFFFVNGMHSFLKL